VPESAWVPAVPLVASGLLWWRMEQYLAAKRNLSRADRLGTVEDLVVTGLISADEAVTLRNSIERLFESGRVV
jgi:hypothetical protein